MNVKLTQEEKKLVLDMECVVKLLSEGQLWKSGETHDFIYDHWKLTLRKEEAKYAPYAYAVVGSNMNGCGSWSRRYISVEKALLHVFNRFNENESYLCTL